MATLSVQTPFGGGSGYDPLGSLTEIGVNNGIGNLVSGYVGRYFGKKSASDQLDNAIAYSKWQARYLPTHQKQGLIAAGYNPLLAIGSNFGGNVSPSAFTTYQAMANLGSNSHAGATAAPYKGAEERAVAQIRNAEVSTAKSTATAARAEAEVAKDEASARQAEAKIAEIEALATIEAMLGSGRVNWHNESVQIADDPSSKNWHPWNGRGVFFGDGYYSRLVDKVRNQIDRDAYLNSREHAIFEDGINTVHGINSGASAYEHWRSSRRPRKSNFIINVNNNK